MSDLALCIERIGEHHFFFCRLAYRAYLSFVISTALCGNDFVKILTSLRVAPFLSEWKLVQCWRSIIWLDDRCSVFAAIRRRWRDWMLGKNSAFVSTDRLTFANWFEEFVTSVGLTCYNRRVEIAFVLPRVQISIFNWDLQCIINHRIFNLLLVFSRLWVVHQLLFDHGLVHEILDLSGLKSFHSVKIETALSLGVMSVWLVKLNCFSANFDAHLGWRLDLFLLAKLIYTLNTPSPFILELWAPIVFLALLFASLLELCVFVLLPTNSFLHLSNAGLVNVRWPSPPIDVQMVWHRRGQRLSVILLILMMSLASLKLVGWGLDHLQVFVYHCCLIHKHCRAKPFLMMQRISAFDHVKFVLRSV